MRFKFLMYSLFFLIPVHLSSFQTIFKTPTQTLDLTSPIPITLINNINPASCSNIGLFMLDSANKPLGNPIKIDSETQAITAYKPATQLVVSATCSGAQLQSDPVPLVANKTYSATKQTETWYERNQQYSTTYLLLT